MPVRSPLERGEPVIYSPDPCLFGEMEVWHVRKHKGGRIERVVCRVDPDTSPPVYELFSPEELEVVGG